MIAVFRRELKAYLASPIGPVFMGLFLLVTGIFFAVIYLLNPGAARYVQLLNSLTLLFVFIVPILTMRLLSEDARQKTDQLLLTSPVSVTGVVLGKYLAAVAVFLLTLAATLAYPLIMSFYALGGLAWAEIVGGYIGFFLLGAGFISIGLFFSSLTDNQLVAALASWAANLLIWILDAVTRNVPSSTGAGLVFMVVAGAGLVLLVYFATRSLVAAAATGVAAAAAIVLLYLFARGIFEGLIGKVLAWFSLLNRYSEFSLGILGLGPVVYYLSFSAVFVFLAVRMVDRRRWM
jgi:ABC-2 type transport system permease protein